MKEETYAGTPESAQTIGITPEHAITYTANSDRELTPRKKALERRPFPPDSAYQEVPNMDVHLDREMVEEIVAKMTKVAGE